MRRFRSVLVFTLIAAAITPLSFCLQSTLASKPEFEAASVRQDYTERQEPASIPFSTDDSYPASVTLLRADFTLDTYIAFAYKLWETPKLRHDLLAGQPSWVGEQRYRIQARIPENSTKDQVRLMMQSLLAERFGLKVHFESHQVPVLALRIAKSGVFGPDLKHHEDGPACSLQETTAESGQVFPASCGDTEMKSEGALALVGARNVTMDKVASFLGTYGPLTGEFDRDVINETGLQGNYDYTLRFARRSLQGDPEDNGPSLVEALHDQLGMKLTSKQADVQRLIIDHIERPSDN